MLNVINIECNIFSRGTSIIAVFWEVLSSVVGHVTWCGTKLGIRLDYFVYCLKKVLFCSNLQ